MKSLVRIFLGLILFNLASCKSTRRVQADAPSELVEPEIPKMDLIDEPMPQTDIAMPVLPNTPKEPEIRDPQMCTMEFNPSHCYFRNYKDKKIVEFDRIYGWGNNPCAAKNNLSFNTEQKKLKYEEFSDLICVPDAAVGLCSQIKTDCATTENKEYVSCHLQSYKNKKFMPHDVIFVVGESRCEARVKMEQELCRRNLYSQSVSEAELICEEFENPLKCDSPTPKTCVNAYRPAVCVVNNSGLSEDENTIFASTQCESENTLKNRLCLRGFTETFLNSNIVCE